MNQAFSISFCIAELISHTLFQALHLDIQAYKAFLLTSIIFAHTLLYLFHHITIVNPVSVFTHTHLSLIQKSKFTKSQFLNLIFLEAVQ
ncbi:hypothetical protein HOF65_02940 [bacterium]|nr:hypothetical protein [bacterium]MBT3852953.1 hypothetical protein [bacterium]MBT4633265.1 hypothetical protein [bacterium]MBT6779024.1 hypothetical protein [bacterium]